MVRVLMVVRRGSNYSIRGVAVVSNVLFRLLSIIVLLLIFAQVVIKMASNL